MRGDEEGEIVYVDRSIDVETALIENGRAHEWRRLAPFIGGLVGALLAAIVALFHV